MKKYSSHIALVLILLIGTGVVGSAIHFHEQTTTCFQHEEGHHHISDEDHCCSLCSIELAAESQEFSSPTIKVSVDVKHTIAIANAGTHPRIFEGRAPPFPAV